MSPTNAPSETRQMSIPWKPTAATVCPSGENATCPPPSGFVQTCEPSERRKRVVVRVSLPGYEEENEDETMYCQSGESARLPPMPRRRCSVPSEMRQKRRPEVRSVCPSGETNPNVEPAQPTPLHCVIVLSSVPSETCQTLFVLSSPPETSSWPSGVNAV